MACSRRIVGSIKLQRVEIRKRNGSHHNSIHGYGMHDYLERQGIIKPEMNQAYFNFHIYLDISSEHLDHLGT